MPEGGVRSENRRAQDGVTGLHNARPRAAEVERVLAAEAACPAER